jgi:hypothetical protein
LYATSGSGLIAVQRRDAEAAAKLYDALKPQRGTASLFVPLTYDRLLGLLAVTATEYAAALRRRGDADDERKATELQEASLAVAEGLAMRPLIELIVAQRNA